MLRRLALFALLALTLAGCLAPPPAPVVAPAPPPPAVAGVDTRTAAARFAAVIDAMEPVVIDACRQRSPAMNCDFLIVVDTRPGLAPNAFQTLDRSGRPVLGFTVALLREARNADELAFILGHEAAHHIEGHIPRQAEQARAGALVAGVLASLGGVDEATLRRVQTVGAEIAARRFAPEFELEADRLGAALAWTAGFDPIRGAAFFERIPDPGNAFLATHPPNALRMAEVRRVVARLEGGARF